MQQNVLDLASLESLRESGDYDRIAALLPDGWQALQRTGSVLAAAALHVVYNVLSIGHERGWFVTATFPARFTMPTLLVGVAAACALALAILGRVGRPPAPQEVETGCAPSSRG